MSINEMIKNVNALAIPGLEVPLAITVDELTETVRNVMFERFISAVAAYSEVCGLSPMKSREFAVDFMQNNGHAKVCLRVTVNLVLNGGFSDKTALDGFLNRLLWSHVVEACHEKIGNKKYENILAPGSSGIIVIPIDDDESWDDYE